MGTNFYKVLPAPEDFPKQVKKVLEEVELELIKDGKISYDTQEKLDNLSKSKRSIHLGKRSGGWQFLWNHNDGEYYDLNIDSIKEFLNQPGIIEDEYGEQFTVEEFLEDEIGYALWGDKEHADLTGAKYYQLCLKDPDTYGRAYRCEQRAIEIKGKAYPVEWHDIIVNGLRFATTTEFS